MTQSELDTIVVGAGPYGLAATAHLRGAGVETLTIGDPMSYWRTNMPAGMFLRSSWDASHISDPDRALTLDHFQQQLGRPIDRPIPLSDFQAYGCWFQSKVAPDLERRRVKLVDTNGNGFTVTLEDDRQIKARRVVIATGLAGFARRPSVFETLDPDQISHSADHSSLARFASKSVVVVGAGQSAIEMAVLLAEQGAEVEVIHRAPRVRWLNRSSWLHRRGGLLRQMLYDRTDVGPPILSQIVGHPSVFRRFPISLQPWIARNSIRPAASQWLRPRSGRLTFTAGRSVSTAVPRAGSAYLKLDDGTVRVVDHVVCATGFRIDISRNPVLSPGLKAAVATIDGLPRLNEGFESSVGGLHFIGATASASFGPVMRFVSGTTFAASALGRHMSGRSAR